MKKLSKYLSLVLLSITLGLSGCSAAKKTPAEFDQYLNELPAMMIDSNDMNLNYSFNDPEKFGIIPSLYELPYSEKADYDEATTEIKEILAEFKTFDTKQMSAEQKLNYDILVTYFNDLLVLDPYYEFENNYLGSFIGFQAQLPLLLSEFTINRKSDYDSLVNILKTSEAIFIKYGENEVSRQANGFGLTKSILKKVIEQCDSFIKGDPTFINKAINTQIDEATFFTEDEKTANKNELEQLVTVDFVKAYESLKNILLTIENAPEDLGLATREKGKEYYQALLQRSCGIDMTIDELEDYLDNKFMELVKELNSILSVNPTYFDEFSKGITYGEFSSAEENLDYLKDQLDTYYPSMNNLTYSIQKVPEAMKDNFSPAAYLTAKIDMADDERQSIFINGEYSQDLFTTIAHEGYPGHMYQSTFFQSLKLPTVRYLIDYNGYSEGWATYVENRSYQFSKDNQDLARLASLNTQLTGIIIMLSDIGIHYHGWTFDQYSEYIKMNFGEMPTEDIQNQFLLNLETPTNYANYYLNGLLYEDLFKKAEAELGPVFSPIEFNRILLTVGPSSFKILEAQVDAYINENK